MPDLVIDEPRTSGAELGYAGFSEHVEPQHIYENLQPAPSGWFGGTEPMNS